MKRLFIDAVVVVVFVAQYFLEQVMDVDVSSKLSLIFDPLLLSVIIASVAAWIRAILEQRMFIPPFVLWLGGLEWAFVVTVSYMLTCFLDVMHHAPENFVTVFGVNLFVLLIPTLVISTGVYAATRSFVDRSSQ